MLERLLDAAAPDIPVMVQGATGRAAQGHVRLMRRYGTSVAAGVSRRADVEAVDGVPVFATCREAVAASGAEASVVMVPPLSVRPAVEEALQAGIRLLVTVTEGVPVHDALHIHRAVREAGAVWLGASTPGLAVPGRLKLGFLPEAALEPGPIAIWSKSGTLSYEVGLRLVRRELGQSAWIGVGGDPVKGTRFADLVPLFAAHAPTRAVVVIGEIGGSEEEELAETLRAAPFGKPVHALLAGAAAPSGVSMGHAGAIIEGDRGTLRSKIEALEAAGVRVHRRIDGLVDALAGQLLGSQRR